MKLSFNVFTLMTRMYSAGNQESQLACELLCRAAKNDFIQWARANIKDGNTGFIIPVSQKLCEKIDNKEKGSTKRPKNFL